MAHGVRSPGSGLLAGVGFAGALLAVGSVTDAQRAPARAARPAAVAGCRVSDTVVAGTLSVAPEGVAPFNVAFRDAPADADLAESGADRVTVHGALEFSGTTTTLRPRIRTRASAARGRVLLQRGAMIESLRPEGNQVHVRIARTRIARVTLPELTIPCAALTIRDPAAPRAPGPPLAPVVRPPGPPAILLDPVLDLFASPTDREPLHIETMDRNALHFTVAARNPTWARIFHADDEIVLQGWVPTSRLDHPQMAAPASSPPGQPSRGRASDGAVCPRLRLGDYCGFATFRAGAEVFVAPNGPRWATVRNAGMIMVVARSGEPWVELIFVPGLHVLRDISLRPAVSTGAVGANTAGATWVRRTDVTLPEGS